MPPHNMQIIESDIENSVNGYYIKVHETLTVGDALW